LYLALDLTKIRSKISLQFQDLRFETVPERRCHSRADDETEGNNGQVAGDSVGIHLEVEPAEVDEDRDVGHVEAVADAAIEGERAAAEDGVDRIARAGGSDEGEDHAGIADSKCRIEEWRASGDGCGGGDAGDKAAEAQPEPDAAGPFEGVQAYSQQTSPGDAVEVDEGVSRREPGVMAAAQPRRYDQRGDEREGQQPGRADPADQRRPEEVVLLFNGEGPGGAESGREREVKEVLDKQEVGPPGGGADRVPDSGADVPGSVEVDEGENQQIDRPDAEGAAGVEVVEVLGLFTCGEKDGRDEEAGETEEEEDPGPAPEGGVVDPRAFEAGVAVIEDDPEDGEAAHPVEFGQVVGQPGWAGDLDELLRMAHSVQNSAR